MKETSMTATPPIVDRETWQEQIDQLRPREKAHTREGDAIAAARRGLPMVEVDPTTPLVAAAGDVRLIDTFEGRTQLFASYMMWYDGAPAAEQCEGCTKDSSQVASSWAGRCRSTQCPRPRATCSSRAGTSG